MESGKVLILDLISLRLPNREFNFSLQLFQIWSSKLPKIISLYFFFFFWQVSETLPCRYALELLKFREAGVEVVLKANLDSLYYNVLLNNLLMQTPFLTVKLIYRTSESDGTGNLRHFITYLDRQTELKSLLKLSKDWYQLIILLLSY